MERVVFQLHVRPERIDEYRERHQAVWPDMLAALSAAGWTNYSLFLRPTAPDRVRRDRRLRRGDSRHGRHRT